MKTRNLWALALVFVAQIAIAQPTVKVAITGPKEVEIAADALLKQYVSDFMADDVVCLELNRTLYTSLSSTVFTGFQKDLALVKAAVIETPGTVEFTYDVSRDYPLAQAEYVKQLKALWNNFLTKCTKESPNFSSEGAATKVVEKEVKVEKSSTSCGNITKTTTTETQTTNKGAIVRNVDPIKLDFKTEEGLVSYITPVVDIWIVMNNNAINKLRAR